MMRIRVFLSVAFAMVLALGATAYAGDEGQTDRDKLLEKLLEVAVDRFELGQYAHAKAELDKLLSEKPNDEEAWKLREFFGDKILRKMAFWSHEGRTLGRAPVVLLSQAQVFDQSKLLDPGNIRAVVREAVRNPENIKYLYKISLMGAHAVPYLLEHLRSARDEKERTNAAYILVHLGPTVVVPVTEALASGDELLQQNVSDVLRRIRPRDQRAVHMLKRVYDDKKNLMTVRSWARRALEELTGQPAANMKPAADYIYQEADRIFQGDALAMEEMDDLQGMFYTWNPKANNGKGFLAGIKLPTFMLDNMYAQELVYDGMALAGERKDFQVLLTCLLLQGAAEIEQYAEVLELQGIALPDIKVHEADVALWKTRLYKNERVAWIIGPEGLMDALNKSLMDGKPAVAIKALKGLQRIAKWEQIAGWGMPVDVEGVEPAAAEENAAPVAKPVVAEKTEEQKAEPAEEPVEGAEVAEVAEEDEEDQAEVVNNPVLTALDHSDRRVRYAAAVCLSRIGFPTDHPRYADLMPVLVDGAREKASRVCLVISNDPKTRISMAAKLEKQGILPMTAPNAWEGMSLAVQYPPKDCIIIDSESQEFTHLHQRLKMHELVSGSPLPLVIITSRVRVENVSRQFNPALWDIKIWSNVSAETPNLYDRLKSDQRGQSVKQIVTVLTNENVQMRHALRNFLQIEAEKHGRPRRQSEMLKLMLKKRLLSDIFAIRAILTNIFLDSELSGYDAMQAVQALRRDERTRVIPIALLTGVIKVNDGEPIDRRPEVEREFKKFIEDPANARLMDYGIEAKDLLAEVDAMTKLNKLSERNFTRKMYDRIAYECAGCLGKLDLGDKLALNEQQVDWLRNVVKDLSRPVNVRTAVAEVFGHFKEKRAAKALVSVFREEDKKHEALRVACMNSLGSIDKEGTFHSDKEQALNEESIVIQEVGAIALSKEAATTIKRRVDFENQRNNHPQKLITELPAAKAAAAAEKPAEEKPADAPADPPAEGDDDDDDDKPAEKTEPEDIW